MIPVGKHPLEVFLLQKNKLINNTQAILGERGSNLGLWVQW